MCRASSSIAAAGVQKSEQFKLNPISRTVSFINCLKFVILAHGRSSLTMKDVKLHHHSQLQFVMRIWSFNFFSSSFICFLVHLLPRHKSNFHFMFPASYRTNVCLWLSMRNEHLYCSWFINLYSKTCKVKVSKKPLFASFSARLGWRQIIYFF